MKPRKFLIVLTRRVASALLEIRNAKNVSSRGIFIRLLSTDADRFPRWPASKHVLPLLAGAFLCFALRTAGKALRNCVTTVNIYCIETCGFNHTFIFVFAHKKFPFVICICAVIHHYYFVIAIIRILRD